MAKNRIIYALFLLVTVIFHSFYTGWFSFFLLLLAVLLPIFSLALSLPAMMRAFYVPELPARCFCGQQAQYRRFATAGGTHQGEYTPQGQREREILQYPFFAIANLNMLQT